MPDTVFNEDFLSKQLEGNTLALGAIAETLQKMQDFLSKQEEMDEVQRMREEEEERMKAEEMARQNFVKEVVSLAKESMGSELSALAKSVSALSKQLVDLQGDKPYDAEGKHPWPAKGTQPDAGDDEEIEAKPRTATSEVQRPIQAMQKSKKVISKHYMENMDKEHHDYHMKDDMKDDVVDNYNVEEEPLDNNPPPVEEEGAAEYPMQEDEYKAEKNEVQLMRKQLADIQKQLNKVGEENQALKKGMEKQVNKTVEERLSKMGYRKVQGNQPQVKTLGLNSDVDIRKSQTNSPSIQTNPTQNDIIEQLSDVSFSALLNAREALGQGNTSGIPKELLGQ